MASGWDETRDMLQTYAQLDQPETTTHTAQMIATHAKAMLDLFSDLRDSFEDDALTVGTSHATLFLQPTGSHRTVNIFYDTETAYHVYIYDPTLGPRGEILEERYVARDEVIAQVRYLLGIILT